MPQRTILSLEDDDDRIQGFRSALMPCLSKSLYLCGLQCPKLLWHTFHEPEAVAAAGVRRLTGGRGWGGTTGTTGRLASPVH
jgi:hypothetical protein